MIFTVIKFAKNIESTKLYFEIFNRNIVMVKTIINFATIMLP